MRFQPNLPLRKDGTRATLSKDHIAVSRNAAEEGMVLLKNNGVLPLPAGSHVALFGKGTFDYVKGGGGSGDVHCPYIRNLYDGFKTFADEVSVYEGTADFYRDYVQKAYAEGGAPGMIAEPALPEELLRSARYFADTAVISISRFSGEGWDRKSTLGGPGYGPEDDHRMQDVQDQIFARSDFYLSDAEAAMVEQVSAAFDRVVVVLNVGGMVDTEWFRANDRISSVLCGWQGGMEGGIAEAEILLGHVNPDGKLADTFARTLEDYPSTAGFHESRDYVNYTEDIYVGYRYFETIPGAAERVNYPFGFGLSYTTFEVTPEKCGIIAGGGQQVSDSGAAGFAAPTSSSGGNAYAAETGKIAAGDPLTDKLQFRARVTNTGDRSGREVVQLYFSAPQGKLGKAARSLIAYRKTQLLPPGGSETVTLTVSVKDLASYDDTGKIRKSAYILEKGTYRFYLGTDVRSAAALPFTYAVAEDTVTEQLLAHLVPHKLPKRLLADGTYETLSVSEEGSYRDAAAAPGTAGKRRIWKPRQRAFARELMPWDDDGDKKPQLIDVAEGRITLDDFVSQIPDELLAEVISGQPNYGPATSFGLGNVPEYGIPAVMTADGPAGVRLEEETGLRMTAFPCATLLACTWDPAVTEAVGRAGGEELKENNLGVWLTPAVNIHRSPLCGRNFEYYSEDPLLAGKQAAGMVRGIQSNNVACDLKHFALNDKETNRQESDSRVSERAAREIYLRQFEIIVKEAHPWAIMSSYNRINGVRSSECSDLLTGILREEWGYDGCVTTDWWNKGEQYKECAAGNDLKMPVGDQERTLEALRGGFLTRAQLETAAKHVLGLILRLD